MKIYEGNLEGYETIKGFSNYRINVSKGLIINKNDKYLMHSQRNAKTIVVNLKDDDGVFRRKQIDVLVYEQVHEPINLKTHKLKHRDKDMYNCALDNLKKVKKGYTYTRKTPTVIVEIETLTDGDEKGHIQIYKSVHNALNSGVTLHFFKKALKNYELDGKPTLVKDKKNNEYMVTIRKIGVQNGDDDQIQNLKFWKI